MTDHYPRHSTQEPDSKPKPKPKSLGCLLMLILIGLAVAGAVTAFVSSPNKKVAEVSLESGQKTLTLTETVSPDTDNEVVVELKLEGEHYLNKMREGVSLKERRRLERRGKLYRRCLAYEIPVQVVVTRVRDNEVILSHDYTFEQGDEGIKSAIPKKSEDQTFRVTVWDYPEIPELQQAEELRVELTVGDDEAMGSRVVEGALKVTQKPGSKVHSLALTVTFLSVLGFFLLLGFFVVKAVYMAAVRRVRGKRGD